jgi:uncharacterized protein (TIRG00374 family)
LSVIIGIAMFAVVGLSVNFNNVFETLQLFSLSKFLILFVFSFILYIITLARWGITINAFGHSIPFTKLLSFRLTEWAIGYVTPFSRLGGEPIMAYLLKKEGKLKFRKGISTIIINKVFDFAAGIILMLVGFVLLIVNYWDILTGKMIFMLIAAIAVLAFLIYQFYVKTFRKEGFFTTFLKPFKEIIHKDLHNNVKIVESNLIEFFKQNKRKLVILGIISFMYQILVLAQYKLICVFLGINVSLVHILIINLFILVAFLVPTPGSLGGMEGAMAFAFALMGFGGSRGFAFTIVLRSVELTFTAAGLIIAYYYGLKSFKKVIEEKL